MDFVLDDVPLRSFRLSEQAPGALVLSRVRLSAHALEVARRYGRTRTDITDVVFAHHARRKRNPGSAGWRVSARGMTVVYEWPDDDDPRCARVVTLWPAR